MNKFLLFLFYLTVPFFSSAQIVDIGYFKEIINYIEEETWVLINLDNTLFEGKQALGHVSYLEDLLEMQMKKGMTKSEALEEVYPLWAESQRFCTVKWVEPATAQVLQDLQRRGIPLMGFTSRRPSVAEFTLRQAASLGMNFDITAPYHQDLKLKQNEAALYTQGILFTHDLNHPGTLLKMFFEAIKQKPKKVLVVDYRLPPLTDLENTLMQENIPYVGFHYRAIEKNERVYSRELANFQLHFLHKVMSNEAALALMDEGIDN